MTVEKIVKNFVCLCIVLCLAGGIASATPTISILNPVNGHTYYTGANVVLNATASAPGDTITSVQFWAQADGIGSTAYLSDEYQYCTSWNNMGNGTYTVTATVRTASGAFVQSNPVTFYVTPSPDPWNEPLANGHYWLQPQNATASRLDANNWGTTNGTKVQLWQANGNFTQDWIFTYQGSGRYKVQISYDTAMTLAVANAGNTPGTKVWLWQDNGSNAQRWAIVPFAFGLYKLNPQCAPGEMLYVSGGGTANGTQMVISTDGGADSLSEEGFAFAAL